MPRLADVVRRHGSAYVRRHRASLLPSHTRALQSIVHCRTPVMGGHVAVCSACGTEHVLYHSCGHRACPQCGRGATTAWLAKQRELLLPVPYFHVVFTLPAELRRLVRAHQKVLVSVLFQAAFEALSTLAADPHYLGADIGALAVLHTSSRTLEWHPHVHMLVPGGGLAPDGRTWRSARRRRNGEPYLVPVKAVAERYRGRFLALARRALPGVHVPDVPWGKKWVVFAKPTVQGADKVLEYLGRYIHKTAISDGAIVAFDERSVTFRYRDSRDHRMKTMTLGPDEFLRRFLQHVLPRGLHRVRAFGLLHPAHRHTFRRLQLLLQSRTKAPVEPARPPRRRCPHCKNGELFTLYTISPAACIELATAAQPCAIRSARAPPATMTASA